tara:strand:- start:799 stop:2682 length:1884 start_codon:yes stop_codon:yes gene_type:complete
MRLNRLSFILLPLFGILIYSNSITDVFIFDDVPLIIKNANIKDFKHFKSLDNWISIENRPFSMFTLAINYWIDGLNPEYYHLTNVLLHILCSLMCSFLAWGLLSLTPIDHLFAKNRTGFSLVVGLIFLAHPLQTQAVNYVIQRMSILAATGYIGAIALYIKARIVHLQKGLNYSALFYYAISGVILFIGLFSKQNVASFPLMLVTTELLFFSSKSKVSKRLAVTILGLFLISIMLYVWLYNGVTRDTITISRTNYLITQSSVILSYFKLLWVPLGLNLDHDFTILSSITPGAIIGMISSILLVSLAIFLKKKYQLISFGILWIYIGLSIESSIIPIRDPMVEHRLYLPMFGFSIILTALFFSIKKNKVKQIIIALLILGYGLLSYQRNKVWESELSIWLDSELKSPQKSRVHVGKGAAYMGLNQVEMAKKSFLRALELDSNNVDALNNLGQVYYQTNQQEKAIGYYNKALALNPLSADVLINIGQAWEKIYAYKEALKNYKKAARINPGNSIVFYNIGNIYRARGDLKNAMGNYQNSIRLNSSNLWSHYNLGNTYTKVEDWDNAIKCFNRVMELDETHVDAIVNLGNVYYFKEQFTRAKELYLKALSLDPLKENVIYNLSLLEAKEF